MNTDKTDAALHASVQRFLNEEAHLLDEARFQEWLTLWAPDGRYWMPCDHSETDADYASSIVNDDLSGLKLRVARLAQPSAHSMSPHVTGCRLISNITIESTGPMSVRSKLLCHEFQRRQQGQDDYRVFCATVRHKLVLNEGIWKIQLKHVLLVDSAGSRTVMPVPL